MIILHKFFTFSKFLLQFSIPNKFHYLLGRNLFAKSEGSLFTTMLCSQPVIDACFHVFPRAIAFMFLSSEPILCRKRKEIAC